MATLTSTISNLSIEINGTTQKSGTISWTQPLVPSGSTINSCILSGVATASMNKGSAIIKINGTTVTSGDTFSINLGTTNSTTSVQTTVVGGNKKSSGTVTFSNLVYTVDYIEPIKKTPLRIKENGIWQSNISDVYKKISGAWVIEPIS